MVSGPKVGVMGAGAIGAWVGGRLLAHGGDVVMVGRPRVQQEIQEHGLTVSDLRGEPRRVPAEQVVYATEASALRDRDIVLVTVKSAQTFEAAGELARELSPGAIIISLQNGVRNADTIRSRIAAQMVAGGIVSFNVVAQGKGEFRRATTGPLVVEHVRDGRFEAFCKQMKSAGLGLTVVENIRTLQWSKLLMNLNNAVGALTDVSTERLIFDPPYRRILAALIAEALGVLQAAGIEPAILGVLPPTWLPTLLKLPTPLLRVVASAQLKVDPEARSSMWQDLQQGRLTEVDYLNGEIVTLAESHHTRAPLNRRIVELVHDAERQGKDFSPLTADALWEALHREAPRAERRAARAP